jgi:hypothetical protein
LVFDRADYRDGEKLGASDDGCGPAPPDGPLEPLGGPPDGPPLGESEDADCDPSLDPELCEPELVPESPSLVLLMPLPLLLSAASLSSESES